MNLPRQIPEILPRSEFHELVQDSVWAEVDGFPLRYDHYKPRVPGPHPCVLFVHGGGWRNGDPSQAAGNGLHFARRGIATISISYRLAPRHCFPAALVDVRRALRMVRANAGELRIDPERIALFGLSAGAHLAMLCHLAPGDPELEAGLPSELGQVREDVRAVIAHYGPYDLVNRRPTADGDDPVAEFLGERVGDESWRRKASPLLYAGNASAPVLLIHGTADTIVSHRQSELMHEALQAAGRSSELLLLEGAPHAFQIEWKGEANRRANEVMDAFLERALLP